jgi:hypothetical protein
MVSSDLRLGAWDYLQRQTNATIGSYYELTEKENISFSSDK